MATTLSSFETQHEDVIHDAQMDYYGRRLATCSSDRSIKIFEVNNDTQTLLANLQGHEGPVWQVAWAHPKFGSILASCSYDRSVIIWKEQEGGVQQGTSSSTSSGSSTSSSSSVAPPPTSSSKVTSGDSSKSSSSSSGSGAWSKLFQFSGHDLSVNSISWAPHEIGLCLACGSSDGTVSILTYQPSGSGDASRDWIVERFVAHQVGVNAVSWCSSTNANLLTTTLQQQQLDSTTSNTIARLVTGGCDNLVKIWVCNQVPQQQSTSTTSSTQQQTMVNKWQLEHSLTGHEEWVRDVQWAPNVGLPSNLIASASQDGNVIIWSQESSKQPWTRRNLEPKLNDVVWRLSWSLTGNILAVTSGDNKVTLWKESLDHQVWKNISSIDL